MVSLNKAPINYVNVLLLSYGKLDFALIHFLRLKIKLMEKHVYFYRFFIACKEGP